MRADLVCGELLIFWAEPAIRYTGITPLGWKYALAVWDHAVTCFLIDACEG
jgi:hypothetical protein